MASNYQVGLIIKGDAKGGVKAVQATKDELTKLNTSQKKFQKESGKTRQAIGNMTRDFGLLNGGMVAMGATVIAAFGALAKSTFDGISSFQKYKAQLKTITGDWQSAGVELDRLTNLAKKTPFTLEQSIEGFTKLTNLGLQPSETAMISYGNTASAMGKDLMQMIEAVADASVGEFERLKEFGIKAKSQGDKVTFTFQGQAKTIKKSSDAIQKYLIDIGNSKFGSAMADQMQTLSAKASNLGISMAQLFAKIGDNGGANAFGVVLDSLTVAVDSLTAHIPSLVNALGHLTKVIAVGGGLYLGFIGISKAMTFMSLAGKRLAVSLFATSLAFKTGVGPVALFTGALKESAVATKAAIVQNGLLKSSLQLLFAAYAGWEFGSYLSEQFVEVRVAGLAFVGVMETGFANINYAISSVVPTAKKIWDELQNTIKSGWAYIYALIGDGFAKIGATGLASSYKDAAANMSASIKPLNELNKELDQLAAKREQEIKKIDQTIVSLIRHEYAQENSTKAKNKASKAQQKKVVATQAELTSNQKMIVALGQQIALEQLNGKQKLISSNLAKLSADASEAERAQVVALSEALYEQQQLKQDNDYLDQLIDGANDLGNAWSSAGNVIIDTFGSIGQQLNKLSSQQQQYAKEQKKLGELKQQYADDPKKLAKIGKAEEQLAYTRTSANLSSYAAISGAASKMFAENSKGRKALHAMETVFTVAEVALAMQRAAANAIAAITNQGNGDPYTAFARIAAMTALMAGLGIAISGGGSGTPPVSAEQRQQNQGTGTVLGSDDKSQSIINAFERIEDLELDQYGELRQMNTSLRDLNNNISRLAVSLIGGYGKFNEQSYTGQLGTSGQLDVSNWLLGSVGFIDQLTGGLLGGIISGFKKTKKTLIDSGISIVSQTFGSILESGLVNARAYYDIKTKKSSWWGLSSSTKYSTEYQGIDSQIQREFALIFTNIGDSINQAVSLLGLDVTRSLDNFIINLGEISFKDMSGDDIQKELEAIFSQQADLMAQYLVPGIGEFQQAGEGLYETLLRVAQEQVVFNQVLELTSQSLNGIDPYQQIQVAQSIIEFAGSIEALQSAANTYLNEFFTDAEQFAFNQQQLNEQFAALNTSLPSTREGFKTLLSSLDLTNEADQRLYAALMLLVPQLDSYYDALEQQGKQAEDAAKKERELALARGEFVESFAEQLARLDMTPLETKLADLTQQFDDYRKQAEELGADTSLLEQLYARKRQAIIDDALAEVNNTYQRELDKLTSTHQRAVDDLVSNNERLAASISTISNNIGNNILALKRSMAGWDEIDYQRGNISNLRGQLGVGSIEQQLGTIDALNTALWDKYQAELDHNRSMSELAQQRYQDDLANYENLTEAAKSLKQAADDLRFGELSIYSTTEQFGFAKSSFEHALASGDLTKLQDAGKQYLEQAKTYYGGTASSEYQAIFERVTNAFGSASAGSAPSIPAEIQQYQQADLALQTELLTELESLQAMTDALNAERTEQFNNDFASLTEAYNDGITALDTTLAEQTSALTDGFNAVVEAVNALPPIKPTVVTPPPDLPPFEIIPMPVEPPIGIGHGSKNDDMAYITPVKPTPGETSLAGSRQLDELVALTRAQNARLEALEMRQAEQNSRNNTRRYIA